MAQFTNKLVVASAGTISMSPGFPVSFDVLWGTNISPFRWTRIWPAGVGASDEATFQTVTVVSEAARWDTPASHVLAVTVRGVAALCEALLASRARPRR